jgi:hypothetical protein
MFPREFAALHKNNIAPAAATVRFESVTAVSPSNVRSGLPRRNADRLGGRETQHYALTIEGKRRDVTVEAMD